MRTLPSAIGAKQGYILGPVLSNFIVCEVLMVWVNKRGHGGVV
jgi:hypothetical protein